ncbi:MAG: autoinducer-2 kinase [Nitrososphaerota archaeon]|nr:autoinducer-2 kinase [Nitrososphaerota archaeon]
MPQYVMAVDAGTGSCRAVIFDKDGHQVSIAQHEWTHLPLPGVPGSQVFDTERNWALIAHCIREAMFAKSVSPSQVKAISASSMREGMVLYDRRGREVWACPNVDSRAAAEAASMIKRGTAEKIFFEGGDWVSITAPPRLLWIAKNEPELFRSVAHLGMISDWILYRLSGKFVTDPSIGSSSAMFNLERRSWSIKVAELCGLKADVLPEVLESGNVAGEVTKAAAAATGLSPGTPVVTGGGDTQLGLLGIGVTDPNRVTVVGGSFWQTTVLMDRARIDRKIRLRTLCHVVPGQWMMEGIGFYCGLTMRWFRDAFCQSEKEEARRHGRDAYAVMEDLAASVPPGSNGVMGVFSNLMNSRRWVHASPSLIQFDIGNPDRSGKKECIRAIEESAGYVALGHLKMIESIIRRHPTEVMMTGGASKGKLWPQVVSDILGVDVSVPVVKESTALGCAIAAGVGAGWNSDLQEAASRVARIEKRIAPSAANHRAYERLYANWLEVYDRALGMVEEGLVRPLWRAVGT